VTLVASFADPDYNRTSVTLASPDAKSLARAARDVAAAALPRVDLTRHSAAHPRLGAVDHVSVHPLGYVVDERANTTTPKQQPQQPSRAASMCARLVGAALAAHPCGLPVYYYGGASSLGAEEAFKRRRAGLDDDDEDDKEDDNVDASTSPSTSTSWQPRAALADLRRRMGYFSPTVRSTPKSPTDGPTDHHQTLWQGAPPGLSPEASHASPLDPAPDEPLSPTIADPRAGVCLVGSTDAWVVNLNAPFIASTPQDVAAAKRVARRVSERGGGLRGVQAMALEKRVGGDEQQATPLLFTGDYAPAQSGGVVRDKVVGTAGGGGGENDAANANNPKIIIEVACNLISPEAQAEAVAREIERLAREEGLEPAGAAYRIGAAPEELVERWERANERGGGGGGGVC
jgi:hypothetical protein